MMDAVALSLFGPFLWDAAARNRRRRRFWSVAGGEVATGTGERRSRFFFFLLDRLNLELILGDNLII